MFGSEEVRLCYRTMLMHEEYYIITLFSTSDVGSHTDNTNDGSENERIHSKNYYFKLIMNHTGILNRKVKRSISVQKQKEI